MRSKSKGISPIIATVLLIAITIAAGLAIYGWVSGLIGSGTSTHMPTSESATITILDVTNTAATLQITNGGQFPISISNSAVVVTAAGSSTPSGKVTVSSNTIPADGTITVIITGLSPDTTYTVTLTGLNDSQGNPVISGSISFTTS
ncbi:archaellin/type IV pilin N-terminal domain-containing protein [Tardisphaera saccharovorans]